MAVCVTFERVTLVLDLFWVGIFAFLLHIRKCVKDVIRLFFAGALARHRLTDECRIRRGAKGTWRGNAPAPLPGTAGHATRS